ncbi:EAL domain-containing protein [Mycoplasmatota bacterium]|nr:EAL domain-containing protein [Mycoplasmatota bacterium]
MRKRRKIRSNELGKQIVGLTIFLDAFFIIALMAIAILVFSVNLEVQKKNDMIEKNQLISENIDQVIHLKLDQLNALSESEMIIEYLELVNQGIEPIQGEGQAYYNQYRNMQLLLNQSVQADSMLIRAFVASEEVNIQMTHTGDLFSSEDDYILQDTHWYQHLSSDNYTITRPYKNNNDQYQMTMIYKVFNSQGIIGYIGFDFDLDVIEQGLNDLLLDKSHQLILLSNDQNLIYMSLDYDDQYLGNEPKDYEQIDHSLGLNDQGLNKIVNLVYDEEVLLEDVFAKKYLIHYNEIEDFDWTVILLRDNQPIYRLEYVLLFIIGFLTIVVYVIYLILNKNLKKSLNPIEDIINSIKEIKNGNYQKKLNIKENNELKDIANELNMMSDEVDRRMKLVHQNMNYNDITGLKTQAAIVDDINKNVLVGDKRVAICLLQIENIKDIIVIMGQQMMNSIMRYVAETIEHMTGREDILFSNTEFELAYIINDFEKLSSVESKINKIIEHFSKPILVDDKKLDVKVFVGVSTYPTDGDDLDNLLKKCEIAIYKDKHSTKKQLRFYNDKISQEISYQAEIIDQLSLALEREEIYLKYQPLVDKKSEVYGFESLARWNSKVLGEISPEVFIANAEQNYLIVPIGTWILREACKAQVELRKKFNKEFVMSVNVSLLQIMQSNYVDVVKKIIRETDINPNYLTLELTESIFINSTITLDDKIADLHKIGVRFSLDDFGTGYASLTYLRQISFDNLKIDKSFIDGVLEVKKDHYIVSMVINLVHQLNMKVIVEGVESLKQFEYLKQISTDVFQGYFISKPLIYDDTVNFVQKFYKTPKAKRINMFTKNNTEE